MSIFSLCVIDSSALAAPAATYVVRSGDYLTGIAAKVGTNVNDLLKLNNLKITSVIHPGDTLLVPANATAPAAKAPKKTAKTPAAKTPAAKAAAPTAAPSGAVYVVKRNDSLSGIAMKHGVKLSALLKANKMTVKSVIMPGSKMILPAGAVVAVTTTTTPTTTPTTAPGTTAPSTTAPTTTIPATTTPTSVAPADQPQSITTLISYLQAQVGKPYQFNGEGPDAFDCSGLVTAAYRQIKISLPHQSLVQSTYGKAVDWKTEPIKAGDLVFMYSSATPGVIGHVGVAVDSTTWIQAARTGTPVRASAMPSLEKIQAVRRIVQQ
ncbi:MAG: LysM peptidoglycan-binding domain-containing protein [Actinobacteria bacterium]|nr:LysM peptidoglycan-binding domain-containing protein [Actinomycetota bacterium]